MIAPDAQDCPCQHPYAHMPLRQWVRDLLGLQHYGDQHRGQLMQRESWLRRPLSVAWFAGGVFGSTIINDWVDGEEGFFGGLRLGYDLNQYWGIEMRFSWGNLALRDSQRAIAYQRYMDDLAGYPSEHVYRRRYDGTRNASLFLWDVEALYYPWGDSGLRPYLLVGLGTSHISFVDRAGVGRDVTQLGMPIGAGLKFRIHKSLALRVECIDNIAVASGGVNTLHNLSLTGAAEFRFGGSKKLYWPWNPGTINW